MIVSQCIATASEYAEIGDLMCGVFKLSLSVMHVCLIDSGLISLSS